MNLTTIHQFISDHDLIPSGSSIIVGLSGGPDSVFLLYFLNDLAKKGVISLVAAHLDHEWRTSSAQDARFCIHLCAKLGIPLVVKKASEINLIYKKNGSKEAHARKLRQVFFTQLLGEYNAHAIALGHHAQDQQETFFIRLIRGTSLNGLTCMKPKNGYYIRPLLETSKQTILSYLHEHNISYVQDPTNTSDDYLRNRIRNKLIPTLAMCDSRSENNITQTIKRLTQADELLSTITLQTFESIATPDGNSIDMKKLLALPLSLQNRVVLHWLIINKVPFTPTERFLQEIIRFLNQPDGKMHALHHAWLITKKRQLARIETTP